MPESSSTTQEIEGTPVVSASTEELGFSLDKVQIEPIAKSHKRSAFVCSNETIQNYCRKFARQNSDLFKNRAYIACLDGSTEVLGYYYLSVTSFKIGGDKHLDDLSEQKFTGAKDSSVPAVYLGMIGVHRDYQGKGIGKLMMMDAMQRTAKIAHFAGIYALTLDAIDEGLVRYYSELGFQPFKKGTTGLEMFLPINSILENITTD